MKKIRIFSQAALIAIFALFAIASAGSKKVKKSKQKPLVNAFVKITPESTDNYANPSLQKFIKDNPGAAIVVRDNNSASGAGISGNSSSTKLCSLIETSLMKAHYNVRDRQIFENVVSKMGENPDYELIHKRSGTDLILEVIDFGTDDYTVSSFDNNGTTQFFNKTVTNYNHKGKAYTTTVPVSYTFTGYHIEIKVILVKENKIGGTFRYYYTPCDASKGGCAITSLSPILRYYDNNDNKSYDKSPERNEGDGEAAIKELSNFVSTVVVPNIDMEMKGGK